jgi:DNA repair exonuclease SbcCD ATPase subunit
MYVSTISLKNWMAFRGEHRVDLPPGPIAIVGRYETNERRSNWSGKTALLESVRFALTGSHRKRTDDSLITTREEFFEVRLEMSTGLVVTRYRKRGGPTVLKVNDGGEVFEREAAERHLAKLLRLSWSDFENTTWFGQNDVQALCGQTSGIRREVFSRWLELDRWERMGKRAQGEARDIRTRLEAARLSTIGAPPRKREDHELTALQSVLMQAEADYDQISHELEKIAHRSGRASSLAVARSDADVAARLLVSIRDALAALPPPLSEEQANDLNHEAATERAALSAADAALAEVRSLIAGRFDGVCPVTCEDCPVAETVSNKRAAFVERGSKAQRERERAARAVAGASEKLSAAHLVSGKRSRLVGQLNEATRRARETRAALVALEAELGDVAGDLADLENVRRASATAREEVAQIKREIWTFESDRKALAVFEQKEALRHETISVIEREAKIAQLVARGLGSSGIPARIAAASLTTLEDRANALLAGLGLSFSLTWERELADPAPACSECGHVYEKRARARDCPSCGAPRSRKKSDELDILVDDGSDEIEDIRVKSGGAKVLVASAIRLAGGMMLREKRGSPLEVAFVDEPFGELDFENRDALARLFAGLLSSVGLEQAFVVSHDAQLLASFPTRVCVMRDEVAKSSRAFVE